MSGYFAIGIEHTKTATNVGTLWREAHIFGASFMFTVGHRYKRQASDTTKAWRSLPLHQFETLDQLQAMRTYDCLLVGVELTDSATDIAAYKHPERAIYLLGAEDHGLSSAARSTVHQIVKLPGRFVHNVAVAGSLVMFSRFQQEQSRAALKAQEPPQ